jgi:hypothetical protein
MENMMRDTFHFRTMAQKSGIGILN